MTELKTRKSTLGQA